MFFDESFVFFSGWRCDSLNNVVCFGIGLFDEDVCGELWWYKVCGDDVLVDCGFVCSSYIVRWFVLSLWG